MGSNVLGDLIYAYIAAQSAGDKLTQQKCMEALGNAIEDFGLNGGGAGVGSLINWNPQPMIELGLTPVNSLIDAISVSAVNNKGYGKVCDATHYNYVYSDYIPVIAGDTIIGEIAVMRPTGATGTAGALYAGVLQYDSAKLPIAADPSNNFIASNITITANSTWTLYQAYLTLPVSHTPYNGSDGGPVRYVRARVLINYSAGTIQTYWTRMRLEAGAVFAVYAP